MKGVCCTSLLLCLCSYSFGQLAKNTLAMTVSGNDRISVVKSSVRLAEWHEKSFWPLYEKYLGDATRIYSLTYRSLEDLAETDNATDEEAAFDNGWKLLNYRNEDLKLKKKYYQQVGDVLNGVIALQFLQTEAMMDMLESASIYSKTDWEKYRFQAHSLPSDQVFEAKLNTLEAALDIPEERKGTFWRIYVDYENESNALLGEAYSVYTLFASDAADFTPALAKRLGNDLLHVMEREIRLKERYFLEMNELVGSTLAARFLAFEDYYSIVSKMYAWADGDGHGER